MTVVYILLGIVLALYFVGCYLAYGAVKADEHGETEYTRWQTIKLTLGSWLTVAISLMGRVQ